MISYAGIQLDTISRLRRFDRYAAAVLEETIRARIAQVGQDVRPTPIAGPGAVRRYEMGRLATESTERQP